VNYKNAKKKIKISKILKLKNVKIKHFYEKNYTILNFAVFYVRIDMNYKNAKI